jgi:AraC family transcriptional regulator
VSALHRSNTDQEPRIAVLPTRAFVGLHQPMSFAERRVAELWRSFMPRRMEVANTIGPELYSMAVYGEGFFAPFDPQRTYEKWAAVEVSTAEQVPTGMDMITVSGRYAVFLHKGPISTAPQTFGHIFGTWFPASPYAVDQRPHFEVMGAKYRPDSPDSEEELWIPIRPLAPGR